MNYLLDGLVALAGFRDDGEVLREYVPGVSVSSGSESLYYHYERLGSVRFLSDSSGSVVSEYVYDGWGNILSSSSSFSQQYEYVGREGHYREGGLYLLGQRWYDSEVGRFISRDPIGEEGGLNLYVYVRNNVVNKIDFEGTQSSCGIPKDCALYIKKISDPKSNPTDPSIVFHCCSCCEWLFGDPCLEPKYLQQCYQNCLSGCLPTSGPCVKPPKHKK